MACSDHHHPESVSSREVTSWRVPGRAVPIGWHLPIACHLTIRRSFCFQEVGSGHKVALCTGSRLRRACRNQRMEIAAWLLQIKNANPHL